MKTTKPQKKKTRLLLEQKEHLLELISEGLESDEINKRAAVFTPPFVVSRQQVDFYRKSRGVKIGDLQEAAEDDALSTGLAIKSERVRALKEMEQRLRSSLIGNNRLHLQRVKMIGSGDNSTIIEYEDFNFLEYKEWRATLDDLAKEVGDRKNKVEHTGADGGELIIRVEYE